jgi:serine/threonine protein kinase
MLEYSHMLRILHNDVKTNNIILQTTIRGGLLPVLIDFGRACFIEKGRILRLDKKQQEEYKKET